MSEQAQDAVLRFLSDPGTYGMRDGDVVRIDTHISRVFLAGNRAFKLKRELRLPYVDYSTLEPRRAFCEKELRLNRRTAHALYRRVVPVTRARDGRLGIGRTGEAVEWLVEMVRFDQAALLDAVARRGELDVPLAAAAGTAAACLHASATARHDHGGATQFDWIVADNDTELAAPGASIDQDLGARICEASLQAVAKHRTLLDRRRALGWVRECHGDLHLANVCLIDGQPVLFDAIEFNDTLSCIDVLYDVAFLVMDLLHRGLRPHANAALNAWLDRLPQYDALALLPLFLSCRAAIRAKVSVTAAATADSGGAREHRAEAMRYLKLAERVVEPGRGAIVAIGGLSGSGKSTLAARLAPALGAAPGAVVLRSDITRKRRFGVDPLERLDDEGYSPAVTDAVYADLARGARDVACAGYTAIVDAACGSEARRFLLPDAARSAGVPFTGLWLDAPLPLLESRLMARRADASDATVDVLYRQHASVAAPRDWRHLDAARAVDTLAADAVQRCLNPE